MKKTMRQSSNQKLFSEAKRVLLGGVDSPVRAFLAVGGQPIPIRQGRGARIYDYDGNEYIDYVLSYGALILGHAPLEVLSSIKNVLGNGLGFGATHAQEVALARSLQEAIPVMKRVRFVTSGTEAIMGAVRLARGVTGRRKILKFGHSYHGHADYLLAKAGSGLATMGLPASSGVPDDFTRHTIVAPYGNRQFAGNVFDKCGHDIAAVLVEPVGGNHGVVPPDIPFLEYLRNKTKEYRSLLIFDEVITGFRFHFGSAASLFGIRPDLICLGKIIGGGLPIGAYGGSFKIMKHLAPLGNVYQASTFAGNPIVMEAGIATLQALKSLQRDYEWIETLTADLARFLREEAERAGIKVTVNSYGNMFSIRFENKRHFGRFYRALLERGVYCAPSEHESNFISFAHEAADIEKTQQAARRAFRLIAGRRNNG